MLQFLKKDWSLVAMNYKDIDLIVRLIAAGKNTYKDLSEALPDIELKTWAN